MTDRYREEFPDFPAADLPAIPGGFEDVSWRNDACPSFINEELKLALYIDYADSCKREFEEGERFTVLPTDDEGCLIGDGVTLMETDDWHDVLRLIDSRRG